jgi:hypothetical protein
MYILRDLIPEQVVTDPFPHLVMEQALDDSLCRQLVHEFPPLEEFTRGRPYRSNQKFLYRGSQALRDPSLSATMKRFFQEYQQPCVWDDLIRLFRPHMLAEYPDFERRFGALDRMRIGVRDVDDFSKCDVLLDSKLVLHTPVTGQPSVERGPHIKIRRTLFLGYLYLRPDHDDSLGADHVFYSIKPGGELLFDRTQATDPDLLQAEKIYPYRRNIFVLFMNSPRSVQGLTMRSVTDVPWMSFHFTAHVRAPLFELNMRPGAEPLDFEDARWYKRSVRSLAKSAWRVATGRRRR